MEHSEIIINCKSSIYTSNAWGMEKAPDFYNQVVKVSTSLSAAQLLEKLVAIEKTLGRERVPGEKYQSRTIDLDILLFNRDIIDSPELTVPHPRMHLRRFVLVPLTEIAAAEVHPLLNKSIDVLLKECPDKSIVKKPAHAL